MESKTPSSPRFRIQEMGSPRGDFIRIWIEDKYHDLSYQDSDKVYRFLMYYLKSNARQDSAVL